MDKILIVDDEPSHLTQTQETAIKAGFTTITARCGNEALSLLRADQNIKAMILDLVMPEIDGMGVLNIMRNESLNIPVIIQTGKASLDTIIPAMRYGAIDYIVKPVSTERITISLQNALRIKGLENCLKNERARKSGMFNADDIITKSPAMERVLYLINKAAKNTIPVLLEGENGVGKELIARSIYGGGERSAKPFISLNCASIKKEQIDSVLFGHVIGAFNNAKTSHKGKFEEAHGGTLFLDEIGELPSDTQEKLLQVIQNGEIKPEGSMEAKKIDVRLISATNKRLLTLAKNGIFREDLYYRLNVFPIYIPPLRDRMEDIAPLAEHFINRFSAETGRRIHGIEANAMQLLKSYDWPENIRQFENAIFRSVTLAQNAWLQLSDFPQITNTIKQAINNNDKSKFIQRTPIHIDDMPLVLNKNETSTKINDRFLTENGGITPIAQLEKELIIFALKRHSGKMSKIARELGIGRSTLYRKLKEYGLEQTIDKNAA